MKFENKLANEASVVPVVDNKDAADNLIGELYNGIMIPSEILVAHAEPPQTIITTDNKLDFHSKPNTVVIFT